MDRIEAFVVVVVVVIIMSERIGRDELSINGFSVVSQQRATHHFWERKRCRGMFQPQSSTHGKQENELTLMS
jgi:hypothetical protein